MTDWADRHPVKRVLVDGCGSCGHSKVFCDCVKYIEGEDCCSECDGHGA